MNITINAMKDGTSQTIKANYYKTSLANFIRGGQTFRANGVIVVPNNDTKWVSNLMNDDLERVENEYNIKCRERNLPND